MPWVNTFKFPKAFVDRTWKIKYDIRYVKDDEFHYTAVPLANNGNAAATTNGK